MSLSNSLSRFGPTRTDCGKTHPRQDRNKPHRMNSGTPVKVTIRSEPLGMIYRRFVGCAINASRAAVSTPPPKLKTFIRFLNLFHISS